MAMLSVWLLTTSASRPAVGRAMRVAQCRRLAISSVSDGTVGQSPRYALPTVEDVRRANFEQATRIGSSVCAAMQATLAGSANVPRTELRAALDAMFSTSIGARGFFSVYLTDPNVQVADCEEVPAVLDEALAQAPADAHRALLRTLTMSTATWSVHRKLKQDMLERLSALTSGRASWLARAVRTDAGVLDLLFQLRAAVTVGPDALVEVAEDELLEEDELALSPREPLDLVIPADEPPAKPAWAASLIGVQKYSTDQKLAVGVALDRVIHQRLAAGDADWRTLPALQHAIESAEAALGPANPGVRVEYHANGVCEITLARGGQLNALNVVMLGRLLEVAAAAASDARVRALLLRSDDANAFSAGGDVRALTGAPSRETRATILHLEYAAIAAIEALARRLPVVAIANGVTMGAGLGVFMAANRRLVSERARLGMPECAIGLCPDAATLHHLTALPPGLVGMYCALTGAALGPADALYAGLGTAHVPADAVRSLEERLREQDLAGLDALLAAVCEPMREHAPLARMQAKVDSIFGQADLEQTTLALTCAIEEVRLRLPAGSARDGSSKRQHESYEWLQNCKARLDVGAPAALYVAQRAMSRGYAHRLSKFDALQCELAINQQLLANVDFSEGVACVVGDRKGERPMWEHESTQDAKSAGPVKSIVNLIDVAIEYNKQAGQQRAEARARTARAASEAVAGPAQPPPEGVH